jgi:NIPSNAP
MSPIDREGGTGIKEHAALPRRVRPSRHHLRWSALPLACAIGVSMSAITPPAGDCCQVLELRQYTLKPGQRDALIELFERHFIESQEATGMTLAGQFRDRRRADRFVWLRGFANMETRHTALETFYGGSVWAAHKAQANATMVDVSDVLLLKPARPELAIRMERTDGVRTVLIGIYQLRQPADASLVSQFERRVAPLLRQHQVDLRGVFVTESAPNTFTRLPVREKDQVLAWIGVLRAGETAPESIDRLATAATLDSYTPSVLELEPTPRSALGGGPKAARASKHDFDFLFGSWKIHNRYLRGRLRQSTEWIEFDAQSHTEPLLHGFGHIDRYTAVRDGSPFEGITLRLFNPATGEWSIHWADTARARTLLPPMVGRFIGGVGEFYGDETVDGKKVLCRFLWTRPTGDSARWEQALSDDGGKTWETNWIMTFTRP